MRFSLFFAVLALAIAGNVKPGQATEGPWCMREPDDRTDCSQPSFEMCHFAALPLGAICYQNPAYRGPAAIPGRASGARKVHRRARRHNS